MIDKITPVVLTYNEAPNIGRSLEKLGWAGDVVVVDSYSRDETSAIAKGFPNVRFFQRKFDSHASQWNFALKETGIKTDWVLALDCDYVLTDEFIAEIKNLSPEAETSGYLAPFRYCVFGRPLRASVYPPVVVLYRRGLGTYLQDGHTQRVNISGKIEALNSPLLHDDRKSLGGWLDSQDRYMGLEADKLMAAGPGDLNAADRVRKLRVVAPMVMFVHCLLVKGLLLDGLAGFYYSFQRMIAESILSLHLIRRDLEKLQKP
jgi:glycosyltransferase involved in cell wall biosynthesis